MQNTEILKMLFHNLYENAEKSNEETKTQQILIDFFKKYLPNYQLQKITNTGLLCLHEDWANKKILLIRADMDAVTTEIKNTQKDIEYKTQHLCGHHGHMTIAAGLALKCHNHFNSIFTIAFLFQPAEETGEGAEKMIAENFKDPTQIFGIIGFHNIPAYPENAIIIKNNTFAAASCGIIIHYHGVAAHAAEPESAINPAIAIAETITFLNALIQETSHFKDFVQITITHLNAGTPNFGLSPANAKIFATLRSYNDEDLKELQKQIEAKIKTLANIHKLEYKTEYREAFPATVNNATDWMNHLKNTALQLNFSITEKPQPFRWSEDFGHYLKNWKGMYFGFGIGKQTFPLHHLSYQFPFTTIEPIVNLLFETIQKIR